MTSDRDLAKYTTIHRIMKDISDLKVSPDAAAKVQNTLNLLGIAIIENAYSSATINHRKTILESDVDLALDSLYTYSEMWDKIFDDEEDEEYDLAI